MRGSISIYDTDRDPSERKDLRLKDTSFCGGQFTADGKQILDELLLAEIVANGWADASCGTP